LVGIALSLLAIVPQIIPAIEYCRPENRHVHVPAFT